MIKALENNNQYAVIENYLEISFIQECRGHILWRKGSSNWNLNAQRSLPYNDLRENSIWMEQQLQKL